MVERRTVIDPSMFKVFSVIWILTPEPAILQEPVLTRKKLKSILDVYAAWMRELAVL
jgi:hypothetical protein